MSKTTRIGSAVMAVILLLSTLLPLTVSAADVTMGLSNCEVSWDYTLTDEEGNTFSAAYGIRDEDNPFGGAVAPLFRRMHDYTAKRKGLTGNNSTWTYGEDYVYCYCVEHGVPLPDSGSYAGSSDPAHGNKYAMLSDEQKDLLSLALAYGYPNRTDLETSKDANACYSASQLIIWQITLGFRPSPTELNDKSYPMSGYSGTMTEQYCANKYLKAYYDKILADMASHYTRPDFTSDKPGTAKTYELSYSDGKYTLTLTDKNNVLSKYYVSSSGGVSVKISGNTLTVSSDQPITDSATIKLNRRMPSTNHTTGFLIWSVPGREEANQDMVSGVPADNDPVPSYFKVKAPAGNLKIIKHSEDGKIGGVPFQISGNGINKTVRTLADGTFPLKNVVPGIYEVTELTENKYEPQATKRVTVVSGQTATVTFDNKLKRGDLTVTKTAEDGFVEDKTFHLYGTSLSGLPVDEYATTDSSGVARFEDVLISGDTPYTLEEIGVEDKYVIPDPQQAVIEWNKVTNKSFDNVLKKWRATITKSDDETGTPQGDATLENAKYGVYKDGQLVDTYLTGPKGEFTTKWYACGDGWTVRELEPSIGYQLNPEVYPVGAEAKEYELEYNELALDVGEQIVKGRVAIIKHTDDGSTDIDTPEEGAEFELFLRSAGSYAAAKDSERDILTCDEYGFAESKPLPFGGYRLHQTKGWPGREMIDDIDIFISENGKVYRYLLNNANFESRIMIVKLDKETGNTVPLAGHGYQLYDPQGEKITMTLTYPEVVEIDTFYTDSNGCLITPEPLPYGEGYSAVEVQAVEPYVLDPTPVYFDILPEIAEEVDGVTVIRVEKENMPQKGTITIRKDGEVFSSVATTGGSEGAPLLYQPVYSTKGLAGAKYDIVATEDVYSGGVLRYSAGQTVATLTTGSDGSATSEPLYLSTFQVCERKAPYGMTLNPEPVTITLNYAGQNVELTTADVSFTNERQQVEIRLQKALEQDEVFGIGMNGKIQNVMWGLYARETMTAADGSVIPEDGLLALAACDEAGEIVFSADLPVDCKVYAKEYSTDEHYILSDKEYDLEFAYQGQDVPVVSLSVNDGQPIENKLIRGDVTGYKVDDDGAPVDGALIGLFAPDETEFTKANALLTCESMAGGKFGFYSVAAGDWLIREIAPAEGFILSQKIFPVTISENEQVIEITIENRWIVGNVETLKLDAEYPENTLAGAVFGIYADTNGNREYDEEVDLFIGNMTELENGQHRMEGLRFGGFFCHEEISPTGFLQDDNYYYFAITEDGETVRVENEAGVGFLNAPIYGELEITKTDSADGTRLANVGFRIRDSLGAVVAEGYTDESGVARFRLRAGQYTYQEFSGLEDYKVVTTEFPFEITEDGQIIQVTVTNEKIPTPEVPQTGDNTLIWPFVALAGASLGTLVLLTLRRKRAGSR